jgi:hypothetical protein
MTMSDRVTLTTGLRSRRVPADATHWLLRAAERGNDATDLDRRHASALWVSALVYVARLNRDIDRTATKTAAAFVPGPTAEVSA